MRRKGSSIAAEIIADLKREEYFKKKIKRNKCIVDSKKQCNICKYREACEDNIEVKQINTFEVLK